MLGMELFHHLYYSELFLDWLHHLQPLHCKAEDLLRPGTLPAEQKLPSWTLLVHLEDICWTTSTSMALYIYKAYYVLIGMKLHKLLSSRLWVLTQLFSGPQKTKSGQTNRHFNQRFPKYFKFRNLNSFVRDHVTIIKLLMLFQMFSVELNFCALLVWVQVRKIYNRHLPNVGMP